MTLVKYFLFFICLFVLKFSSEAQQLGISEESTISILSVGPGDNLYDTFGHSAFRIKDDANERDFVFNYGTYDFTTPNFYTKFAQGKLLYALSLERYSNFYQRYERENRSIKEQVLNLTYSEKKELFNYLQINIQPENRKYKYDFLQDNCATRIRDVLVSVFGADVHYPENSVEDPYTFRQGIQKNVHANSWGSLGMDVAIGAVTDVKMTSWEHQFLPEYVYKAAQKATIEKKGTPEPLVKSSEVILEAGPRAEDASFFTSPLFVFGLLGLLILWITYKDYKNGSRSRYLDAVIFIVTGIIGVLLVLLWFATDHSATAHNYNILWAFPISLLLIFAIAEETPKKWVKRYMVFLILLFALMGLHSITGVQKFPIGLLPIYIALVIRYLYVFSFLKKIEA